MNLENDLDEYHEKVADAIDYLNNVHMRKYDGIKDAFAVKVEIGAQVAAAVKKCKKCYLILANDLTSVSDELEELQDTADQILEFIKDVDSMRYIGTQVK